MSETMQNMDLVAARAAHAIGLRAEMNPRGRHYRLVRISDGTVYEASSYNMDAEEMIEYCDLIGAYVGHVDSEAAREDIIPISSRRPRHDHA